MKNLPSQRDFVLTNREEALIDQLALLAKVSCAAPRRATTTFSTVFVIILAVHHDAIAKGAVPSRLKIDLTNYTQKHSTNDSNKLSGRRSRVLGRRESSARQPQLGLLRFILNKRNMARINFYY